ncbi:MAG: PAS domain S-box protein [Isosphaeraceae bacterium]
MSQAQAMIDSLRAVTAVAIAEIDLSGLLLDANAGFLRLLPARNHPAPGIAVAPSLISPSFARLIELSSSGAETLYEGLMTLGDPTGKSRSFRGSVSRTERGLLLLLEYDVEELSHVAETALELSSELAQAQRALLSSNNQLKLKEAERAQSEQRVRRNESMLAEAQRLAKLGSWNWDILSDQHLWSDECYRIFGLNPHEIGMTFERFLSLVHPDDRETVRRNVELALQEGQPYECTMRAVHPDGTVRIVLSRAQVVRDEGGKAIRMFGTVQDITEQRQLEEALSQEAIRRRILVEQSSDGIVVLDEDGLVFEANQRFGEMLGYTAEEVSQLHVWDWDVQWTREELLRIVRSADESGSHLETRHRRKDGTLLDVEISGNGALCSGRKLIFCVCRDISRRKQAEKDIRNLNASLERRVAERTSELVAANAELARAARLKDEFLASMSHELRTPLNGILTMSESLQEQIYGSLNAGQERAIRDIEECGRHLLALINDILDVAKIEAGKIELETHPVSVQSLCQSSLRMVKDAAHKKKIEVSLAVDETVPVLIADERRVKQILVNLLSNAVKFTPEAGKIGLQVVGDRLNHQLRFSVWDTGIGVSAEEQPRLFKPFSQLDSGLARKYAGTGLGLALVKRLTEMHGGSVGVVSQPGQGSRFTVSLPWIETATSSCRGEREVGPEAQAGLRSNTWESRGTPLILVLEDNAISARSLRDYLEFKGYRVEQAGTGAAGIECAGRLLPDLILVDVQLPGLDGREAVRRMRLLPSLCQVPIIVLTALATADDRERSPQGGATAYLSKPVVLDELRQVIKSLLSRPGKISDGSEVETP